MTTDAIIIQKWLFWKHAWFINWFLELRKCLNGGSSSKKVSSLLVKSNFKMFNLLFLFSFYICTMDKNNDSFWSFCPYHAQCINPHFLRGIIPMFCLSPWGFPSKSTNFADEIWTHMFVWWNGWICYFVHQLYWVVFYIIKKINTF